MLVRPPTAAGVPAITVIYNEGIADLGVTWRARRAGATPRRHARLDGEWKDCVIVERLLGEAAPAGRRGRPEPRPG